MSEVCNSCADYLFFGDAVQTGLDFSQSWLLDAAGLLYRFDDLKFQNFTRDDGLSTTGITSLLQDREGFIWFGTNSGGINRYDGYNFKIYGNVTGRTASLSYSWINIMYKDKNGILWIGTDDGGSGT